MAAVNGSAATPVAVNLLIVSAPDSPELSVLKALPPSVNIVGVGKTLADLQHITDEQWANINVLLNCGTVQRAGTRADVQALWPRLTGLKWIHSTMVGLEHFLFPELVNGPVVLTNAKGIYSFSLAEFCLTAANWFAKDWPRLLAAKAQRKWDPYDVEELRGRTLGVVGYGDIGQATARLAKAFKMRVLGLRRRTELSEAEKAEGVVDKLYSPDQIVELVSQCDYIVMATPYTPATDKMFSAAAIAAMKPDAVFINVGRGKCVDEPALIRALQERKIRGAALDVFAVEPLPEDSPLWTLDNVLISPHCADRTKEFQFESLEFFVDNVKAFAAGEPLKNVCDKKAGY